MRVSCTVAMEIKMFTESIASDGLKERHEPITVHLAILKRKLVDAVSYTHLTLPTKIGV